MRIAIVADIVWPIAVPYDYEMVARLAEKRNRHEWAYALRTGYMPK